MLHNFGFTNRRLKKCSIVNVRGCIVVIDHQNDDRVIEPSCGLDALATYNFLKGSLKHGGMIAAQDFLRKIADGEKPVTEMIGVMNPPQRVVA